MKKQLAFALINCTVLGLSSFSINTYATETISKHDVIRGRSCVKLPAKATSILKIEKNLDANSAPPLNPFSPLDTTSYNTAQEAFIYDSLGIKHHMQIYFVKEKANAWITHPYIDGSYTNKPTTIAFNTAGNLTSHPSLDNITFDTIQTGAISPQIFSIDISCMTQYGGQGESGKVWQDGYGPNWSFRHTLKPISKKSCLALRSPHATTDIKLNINLNATDQPYAGSESNPKTNFYHYSIKTKIYDNLGAPYQLTIYFTKIGSNYWNVSAYLYQSLLGQGTLEFDSSGQLIKTVGLDNMTWQTYSGATPQSFKIDMTCSTQYGSASSLHEEIWQDGVYSE